MTDEQPSLNQISATPPVGPVPPFDPAAKSIPAPSPLPMSPSPTPVTPGMAIASLVLSIVGLLFGWLCCMPLFSILAVVFGHISYSQICRMPHQYSGRGLALAGIIIGYLGMVVSVILGIIVGVASALAQVVSRGTV